MDDGRNGVRFILTPPAYLQQTKRDRKNVFPALMQAVKAHSLEQISHALYEVGGEYRRKM